jgi:hypothetical protein
MLAAASAAGMNAAGGADAGNTTAGGVVGPAGAAAGVNDDG